MSLRRRRSARISVIFLSAVLPAAISFAPHTLKAQSAANSGQIVGQILDPSSAAVSKAVLTVRNKDTNFTRSTTTDASGRYAISVPLGRYEINASAVGLQA